MDLGLAGKRALVLGASKGLGYAIARAIALEGGDVILSSSNRENLDRARQRLETEAGSRVVGIPADLAKGNDVETLVDKAKKAVGSIDILVINHGGPPLRKASELAVPELRDQFQVCLAAAIQLTGLLLPTMRQRQWGRILAISAQSIIQPLPLKAHDNIFRAALAGYIKTLASEVAADGVTVNILMPGTFITERVESSNRVMAEHLKISIDDYMKQRLAAIPAGRFGSLEEFGWMAAFLCSERAGYQTGSVWRVDGGVVRSIV